MRRVGWQQHLAGSIGEGDARGTRYERPQGQAGDGGDGRRAGDQVGDQHTERDAEYGDPDRRSFWQRVQLRSGFTGADVDPLATPCDA